MAEPGPPVRNGFILTRDSRDKPAGTEIEFWLATDDGPRQVCLTGHQSVGFVEASSRAMLDSALPPDGSIEVRPLSLQTFGSKQVLGVYSADYRQLLALEKRLKPLGVELLEADIRPPERYLMERFINASVEIEGGTIDGSRISDCRLKPAPDYRPALRCVSLDIETSASGSLYSIALEGMGQRLVLMLGPPAAEAAQATDTLDFELVHCTDHAQMLSHLNRWLAQHDPDAVIGWNLIQFDLRILQATADQCRVPLLLGRGAKEIGWRRHSAQKNHFFARVPGRLVIDGIEALKSASRSFASYALDAVAQSLLGEGKSIGTSYDKMAEIERRFVEDKPALAAYNIKDCELVTRIFEKAGLLEFLLERANVNGLQADHFGGSIAAFNHHYLPLCHRKGYVAPNAGARTLGGYPGGFVMDSRPGLYDSVVVLDYKSLYPSIIRTFLVDPVGGVEGAKEADRSRVLEGPEGTNGIVFSREVHCLPGIVASLAERRERAKQQRNEPLSQALKLLANSFSGVLGSPDSKFFDADLVSAITLRGHEIMQRTREFVEGRGLQVIYGDTDSIFIALAAARTEAEARAIGEGLASDMNRWWERHLRETLRLESVLELEFDVHYHRFFMPTTRGSSQGSKKRYAGLTVRDDDSDAIVFRGLETARSDWTPLAQRFQQELYRRAFKAEALDEFVRDYVSRTRSGEFDELMVYRKRLRRELGSYRESAPPHVRAARLAERHDAALNHRSQFGGGGWISYVMTVNGPEPAELATSRLDHEHYLEHQLKPIADAILSVFKTSFDELTSAQPQLF